MGSLLCCLNGEKKSSSKDISSKDIFSKDIFSKLEIKSKINFTNSPLHIKYKQAKCRSPSSSEEYLRCSDDETSEIDISYISPKYSLS